MAFLPPEPFYFGDGQPGDTDLGERLSHLIELERLDYGFDFFHGDSKIELKRDKRMRIKA